MYDVLHRTARGLHGFLDAIHGLADLGLQVVDHVFLELIALVRAYVGCEVGFAVNPVLARDAVPPLAMAPLGDAAGARPLLGWNTWLPTSRALPRRTDASDALFESEIVEGHA